MILRHFYLILMYLHIDTFPLKSACAKESMSYILITSLRLKPCHTYKHYTNHLNRKLFFNLPTYYIDFFKRYYTYFPSVVLTVT